MPEDSASAYQLFCQDLKAECENLHRPLDSVQLIAVSKYNTTEELKPLLAAGQTNFAERRVQEALPKIETLRNYPIQWHFIGPLQSNKVRQVANHFDIIHSIDSLKIATRLDTCLQEGNRTRQAFLQVNLAEEISKSGFSTQQLWQDLEALLSLKALHWMGLMILPPFSEDPKQNLRFFNSLRILQDQINTRMGQDLKFLSMGMSGDWREALAAGATHLRIGRALFT